jgi:hypothetical protein
VQVDHAVPGRPHGVPDSLLDPPIGVHVQQDSASVPDEAVRPARDDARAYDARKRVHPQPAEGTRQEQADDDQHRHCRVRHHVDDRGSHVVVAVRGAVGVVIVVMFVERNRVIVAIDGHADKERVGFRYLVLAFQVSPGF